MNSQGNNGQPSPDNTRGTMGGSTVGRGPVGTALPEEAAKSMGKKGNDINQDA